MNNLLDIDFHYIFQLERYWRKSQRKLSDDELIEAFGASELIDLCIEKAEVLLQIYDYWKFRGDLTPEPEEHVIEYMRVKVKVLERLVRLYTKLKGTYEKDRKSWAMDHGNRNEYNQ